jgi:hypothetical protein
MTRNVDVMEEKMDLVTNLNYYFYLNGENVAKRNSEPMQFSFLQFLKNSACKQGSKFNFINGMPYTSSMRVE